MAGLQVEQDVLCEIIAQKVPKLAAALDPNDLQLLIQLFATRTLLPLFVNVLPPASTLFLWDLFFREGEVGFSTMCTT